MTEGSARHSGRLPTEAGERQERFAALIRAERTAILTSYAKSLEGMSGSVLAEPSARDQAVTIGTAIITDLVESLKGGGWQIGDRRAMLASIADGDTAENPASLADLLRAAATFFDVTVNALACHVKDDPEMLSCFVAAILALNDSISRRIEDATLAYTSYLLERVDDAHIDERRRMARDLHDRLGEGLSVALRQLELHEIASEQDPLTPRPRVAVAKEAVTEAMRRLRAVTSDLRQDSVRNLEEALVQYIDSVATADADVRLRVSGDETWAPPAIIDEAFLIIREAIRNALRHGVPQLVLIGVVIAPHEFHAWVEDDGCGFVPASGADSLSTGTGIVSMRERAAVLGGRLAIASAPKQGTRVELLVPLPGRRNE